MMYPGSWRTFRTYELSSVNQDLRNRRVSIQPPRAKKQDEPQLRVVAGGSVEVVDCVEDGLHGSTVGESLEESSKESFGVLIRLVVSNAESLS